MRGDMHAHELRADSSFEAQVISLSELQEPETRQAPVVDRSAANPLHAIRTRLEVSVGGKELPIGELLAMSEGDVIELDADLNAPVELRLQGHPIALGQLVAVDGRFAFRVTSLPASLNV